MSSHKENDHIQKEAKNVDLILVIACSSLIPNIYIIKWQDLGEKVYVNRITKFLKKHNLCFSDPIFIFLGHSFCSNWYSQMSFFHYIYSLWSRSHQFVRAVEHSMVIARSSICASELKGDVTKVAKIPLKNIWNLYMFLY